MPTKTKAKAKSPDEKQAEAEKKAAKRAESVDATEEDLAAADEKAAEKAEKIKVKKPKVATDLNTQPDFMATPGRFCRVVSGEHEGRYGVLEFADGPGNNVVVVTRDDRAERLSVDYGDLVPARPGGR